MKEQINPFRYWRMKIPLWKRIYWKLPWVQRRHNQQLAEQITQEYFNAYIRKQ